MDNPTTFAALASHPLMVGCNPFPIISLFLFSPYRSLPTLPSLSSYSYGPSLSMTVLISHPLMLLTVPPTMLSITPNSYTITDNFSRSGIVLVELTRILIGIFTAKLPFSLLIDVLLWVATYYIELLFKEIVDEYKVHILLLILNLGKELQDDTFTCKVQSLIVT